MHVRCVLFYIVLVIFGTVFLYGCEDPGVVGSNVVKTGARVQADTLRLDRFSSSSKSPSYTGNLAFMSVGSYDDAIFGDVKAVGVLKPSISTGDIDTLPENGSIALELDISTDNVYGDTTSTTNLKLVEIGSPWRGASWQLGDQPDLTSNVLAQDIQIDMEDSVVVKLPDTWYKKYRDFYYRADASRDSTYLYNFHGFALVPEGGDKIVAINADSSSFHIKTSGDSLVAMQGYGTHGYSVQRSNVPQLSGVTRVYSNYEQVLSFDVKVSEEKMESKNLSRGELVLYQAENKLENALPSDHVRPDFSNFKLFLMKKSKLEYTLDLIEPLIRTSVDSTDYTYRYNITRFINQELFISPIEDQFVGGLQSNNGIIYSTLIYSDKADEFYPKILITTVNPETDS